MNYLITRGKLEDAPKAPISQIPWGSTYTPETYFQAVLTKEGFHFRFTRMESDPKITKTGYFRAVSCDSCVELFMNFAPDKTDEYINFEMNAGGGYLFCLGKDRFGRRDLECRVMPRLSHTVNKDDWSVDLVIPFETLYEVYGVSDFPAGTQIKGNAYSCGTAPTTHYLTWAPVQKTERDFHKSACFGTFTIL